MTSFFSPKSRFKTRSNPSLRENIGHTDHVNGDHFGSFSGKSTFSKMRKKRPPPINISVGNGNVILTSATPTSRVIHADSQWPTTPETPHTGTGCANPRCIERESGLRSFLKSEFDRSVHPWLQSTSTLNPSPPPKRCFPMAELPGSAHGPRSVELHTPSTPQRQSFEHAVGSHLESPLNLTSKSTLPDQPAGLAFEYGRPSASMHNGRQALELKHAQQDKSLSGNESRPSSSGKSGVCTQDRIDRMKSEYELQLDQQKNEICSLLELHETRMAILCDFISERHGTGVNERRDSSQNCSLHKVFQLVNEQKQRVLNTPADDATKASQSLQIQKLQAHAADLVAQIAHRDRKLQSYKAESRTLKEQLRQEIKEKDAQISILNSKVTQLLNMGPSLFPASPAAHRVEKELPSPGRCSGRSGEKSKRQLGNIPRTPSAVTAASSRGPITSVEASRAGHLLSHNREGKQRRSTVT
ncbi:hypothetical protein CPC735_003790 [Coccidioides posadasii C735 delta SOWgp]|uniref:Uncharacterized protein n=1 Tax=Coccidioides posadasii (strain C735) TaxID=222929 RepID=C5P8Z8_COCP7|nr:hypothetical protein CPC735_003790 [Coccidioides posadasii C735 delta SOWgp]EER26210.1 hypothetical protein CPC735_003790 [Coccidioides posadasii C735 delta SOWgp]|eukprot:XP_003068355.1 hypothetical protein CPC735_003790 [Coccidioides posadasii C735 delta SOWgp]